MNNKFFQAVKDGSAKIALSNGYLEFGYGCPVDPVLLDYREYLEVKRQIVNRTRTSFFDDFENKNLFDIGIPTELQIFLGGFSVLTIAEESICTYSEDISISVEKKKKIFEKLLI